MKTFAFHAEAAQAGARLDQFLAATVPSLSRSRIQDLIKAGHVTLNGLATKPGARLRADDAISLSVPPPVPTDTAAEAIALDVLFEDDDLIVINKPVAM